MPTQSRDSQVLPGVQPKRLSCKLPTSPAKKEKKKFHCTLGTCRSFWKAEAQASIHCLSPCKAGSEVGAWAGRGCRRPAAAEFRAQRRVHEIGVRKRTPTIS